MNTAPSQPTPLVILHGWGLDAQTYAAVVTKLESQGISCVIFDLPGFGIAAPPPVAWNLDAYVAHVSDELAKRGVTRMYLLGHSFGGRIAIKYARRFPEQLAGLILYDAGGIKPVLTVRQRSARAIAALANRVLANRLLGPAKDFFRKALYRLAGTGDYYRAQGVMKLVMQRVIDEDLEPVLPQVHVPTLVLWGENDTLTPLRDGHIMHHAIAGSQLHIAAGVGHSWHKQKPDEWTAAVHTFIHTTHG